MVGYTNTFGYTQLEKNRKQLRNPAFGKEKLRKTSGFPEFWWR
jgi:hypothetical protein